MTIEVTSENSPADGAAAQPRACRRAAQLAAQAYPGALGELVQRELLAFAEFGHRLPGDGLIPRLAAEVLRDARATPPAGGAGR